MGLSTFYVKFVLLLIWTSNFTFSVRWGGWLEKVKLKLNSTQVVVEVRVELGNSLYGRYIYLI